VPTARPVRCDGAGAPPSATPSDRGDGRRRDRALHAPSRIFTGWWGAHLIDAPPRRVPVAAFAVTAAPAGRPGERGDPAPRRSRRDRGYGERGHAGAVHPPARADPQSGTGTAFTWQRCCQDADRSSFRAIARRIAQATQKTDDRRRRTAGGGPEDRRQWKVWRMRRRGCGRPVSDPASGRAKITKICWAADKIGTC